MKSMKNYHKILRLSPSASEDEIGKAYRRLAFEYHPDRNKDNKKAAEKFKEVTEAYERLTNPEKFKRSKFTYVPVDPVQRRTGLTPEEVRTLNYTKLLDLDNRYKLMKSLSKFSLLSLGIGASIGSHELYQEHFQNPSVPLALVSLTAIIFGYSGRQEAKKKMKTLEKRIEDLRKFI